MKWDPRQLKREEGLDTGTDDLIVLSECVRMALSRYFAQLGEQHVTNLYALVMQEVEKPLLETVLERCAHNQSRAAGMLGMSRSTLRKKITQYGLG